LRTWYEGNFAGTQKPLSLIENTTKPTPLIAKRTMKYYRVSGIYHDIYSHITFFQCWQHTNKVLIFCKEWDAEEDHIIEKMVWTFVWFDWVALPLLMSWARVGCTNERWMKISIRAVFVFFRLWNRVKFLLHFIPLLWGQLTPQHNQKRSFDVSTSLHSCRAKCQKFVPIKNRNLSYIKKEISEINWIDPMTFFFGLAPPRTAIQI
jgi:hypothetical protein